MDGLIQWAAPIVSTALTAYLTSLIARSEKKTDEKRAKEAEWRDAIEQRLDKQEEKLSAVLDAQCTQMRSDITHKIHRYMDDLHCASTEEKQSLFSEYEIYCGVCTKFGIENHFVERLIQQVMELPDRPPK